MPGDVVAETVRREDPDRYFADLFAPGEHRPHLLALHAFDVEIAAIRYRTREPIPGEIRLQWWRDAIAAGEGTGNPIADALLEAIRRYRLPVSAFERLLDARAADLYDDPMPDLPSFEAYAGDTVSSLFQLAAIILAGGDDPGSAEAAGHAGVAYGLATQLRLLPVHARQGRILLPVERLSAHGGSREDLLAGTVTAPIRAGLADLRAEARRHCDLALKVAERLPGRIRIAFLPLALIERYLRLMDGAAYEPLGAPVELSSLRRQWSLWRAARALRP